MFFFSSHVQMWELDHKKGWELKNWYSWTVVLEKTLESPLDSNPKGNQPWIFIGRTDAEAETPILWPPDTKNWLIGKKPWCWERLKAEEGDHRGWDGWIVSPIQWTGVWANSRRQVRGAWRAAVYGVAKSQTWLSDWTTATIHLGESNQLYL